MNTIVIRKMLVQSVMCGLVVCGLASMANAYEGRSNRVASPAGGSPVAHRASGGRGCGDNGLRVERIWSGSVAQCAFYDNRFSSVFFSEGYLREALKSGSSVDKLAKTAAIALCSSSSPIASEVGRVLAEDKNIPGVSELALSGEKDMPFDARVSYFAVGCARLRAFLYALSAVSADSDGHKLEYVRSHCFHKNCADETDDEDGVEAIANIVEAHLPNFLLGRLAYYQAQLIRAAGIVSLKAFWDVVCSPEMEKNISKELSDGRPAFGSGESRRVWDLMITYSKIRLREYVLLYDFAKGVFHDADALVEYMETNPIPNGIS